VSGTLPEGTQPNQGYPLVSFNSRQWLVIVAVVVVVAAGLTFYFVSRQEAVVIESTTEPSAGAVAERADSGDALMVAGPLGEMTLGDPNAPNVVIEYASMTCPHCQRFHTQVFPALKEKYIDTGRAYFIFREFPLDPLATSAIMLARCAPKENFFPMVDLLFQQQATWAFVQEPVTALRDLVKQAGISADSFQACLTNQEILDGVNWVKTRASTEFDVGSTPTFFFNGQMHPGEIPLEEIDGYLGG
jgi:protein-disulfide isomerase